ncbi:hypothetical protein GDO81_002754 [Engystomops pustulosus]|uniref:Secreted protein n=1 Tax=Engystomops pustulosus TaxID=76066 RepID=A0AAV7DMQ6_ENGPU|nr:hypothetical protein GDO81_002754 [Engystomops pustulosus]
MYVHAHPFIPSSFYFLVFFFPFFLFFALSTKAIFKPCTGMFPHTAYVYYGRVSITGCSSFFDISVLHV